MQTTTGQETTGQEFRDEVTGALAVLLYTDTAQNNPCEVLIKALLTIKEFKGLAAVERVLTRTIDDLSAIAERVQDEIDTRLDGTIERGSNLVQFRPRRR